MVRAVDEAGVAGAVALGGLLPRGRADRGHGGAGLVRAAAGRRRAAAGAAAQPRAGRDGDRHARPALPGPASCPPSATASSTGWPRSGAARRVADDAAARAHRRGPRPARTARRVDVDGRYVHLDGVALDWPPATPPPLLVGARGAEDARGSAGEVADGVLLDSVDRRRTPYAAVARLVDEGRDGLGRAGPRAGHASTRRSTRRNRRPRWPHRSATGWRRSWKPVPTRSCSRPRARRPTRGRWWRRWRPAGC